MSAQQQGCTQNSILLELHKNEIFYKILKNKNGENLRDSSNDFSSIRFFTPEKPPAIQAAGAWGCAVPRAAAGAGLARDCSGLRGPETPSLGCRGGGETPQNLSF